MSNCNQIDFKVCNGFIDTEMNYRVSKGSYSNSNGVYKVISPDGEEIYRVSVCLCSLCSLELEKKLDPDCKSSLIVRRLCKKCNGIIYAEKSEERDNLECKCKENWSYE